MYQLASRKQIRWWAGIGTGLVAIIFISTIFGWQWFIGSVRWTLSPIQQGLVGVSTLIDTHQSRSALRAANATLQQQLTEYVVDAAQLHMLELENQALREQLGFVESLPYRFVTARIIAANPQDTVTTVEINQGAKVGVTVGLPVIAGEGVLIGRIMAVEPQSATVLLLSDNGSRIAATVQNQDQTIGVVIGAHGLSVQMDMIPRDELIAVGNIIVTSGMQAFIPRGLVIGTIASIDTVSSKLFSKAFIKPLVDYRKLNMVTVLVPTQ
ncbi:MAG: rod shape-determining protein MreC [Patescibacteria group bacterium]